MQQTSSQAEAEYLAKYFIVFTWISVLIAIVMVIFWSGSDVFNANIIAFENTMLIANVICSSTVVAAVNIWVKCRNKVKNLSSITALEQYKKRTVSFIVETGKAFLLALLTALALKYGQKIFAGIQLAVFYSFLVAGFAFGMFYLARQCIDKAKKLIVF